MPKENDKYSLWIVPSGDAGKVIQTLVNKLADENGAPRFVPHLTLVANIFADDTEVAKVTRRIKQYSENLEPFRVKLAGYGHMDEEFRCLYLLVESTELQSVYESLLADFPQISNEHFQAMPHLSVLYGNYPDEKKKQIMVANPILPVEFMVNSLDLYLTNIPTESWRLTETFPLAVRKV